MHFHQALIKTLPSSGIQYSTFCRLSSRKGSPCLNLVTASSCSLSVYEIEMCSGSFLSLVHIVSFELEGVITGIQKISSRNDINRLSISNLKDTTLNDIDLEIYGSAIAPQSQADSVSSTVQSTTEDLLIVSFHKAKVLSSPHDYRLLL